MTQVDAQARRDAVRRIKRTIENLQSFDSKTLSDGSDPHLRIFDEMVDRAAVKEYAGVLVPAAKPFSFYARMPSGASKKDTAELFDGLRSAMVHFLRAALIALDDEDTDLRRVEPGSPPATQSISPPLPVSPPPTVVASRKVFVVHGANKDARAETTEFLRRLQLEPIVLMEQPDGGRTIIEKFEQSSDVNFVVVLLTDDDVGGPKGGDQRPRARQNVVMELGYFIGYFRSRARICVLKRGDVEEPSDLHGVVYTDMDSGGGWKLKLARELNHAGVKVDLNLAL
jgi:hypothetical protein